MPLDAKHQYWNAGGKPQDLLIQEAARIFCEERLTDYRLAKQKAAQRLRLGPHATLPDNAIVQRAVIDYQNLFGGRVYRQRLRLLRETAVQAMKLLAEFQPRLAGAVISGAVNEAHRVQLHVFDERAETVEIFLRNLGIDCKQDERRYRHANGREHERPLVCFNAGGIGVDAAVFPREELHHPPLDPEDGLPSQRLDIPAALDLLREGIDAART